MKIALDAMGGDFAPRVTVEAAAKMSLSGNEFDVVLVGDEVVVRQELAKHRYNAERLSVVHTDVAILMDDAPSVALRQKRNSSISLAIQMHKEGKVQGVVSAGNSGAVMASALIELGRLKDITRPAIALTNPTTKGFCVVLDAGANADCKPVNLLEFGCMGSIFAQHVLGIQNPKVGLLSIGEESSKGNEMTIEANQLLAKSKLNFIGNIEGRDILKHTADVVVCDGFVGNIILKFEESFLHVLKEYIKANLKGWRYKLGALLLKPMAKKFARDYDPDEYGGQPLLGINGNVFIGHGSSSATALFNAIKVAGRMSTLNVNRIIEDNLGANR